MGILFSSCINPSIDEDEDEAVPRMSQININHFQEKIDFLERQNEQYRKILVEIEDKRQAQLTNNDKNVMLAVESFIDEWMKNDYESLNIPLLTKRKEKEMYKKLCMLAVSALTHTLDNTKLDVLNHEITFNMKPAKQKE